MGGVGHTPTEDGRCPADAVPGCQPSASAASASSQSGIPNAGHVSWHCSDPEGGPDVGVSLVIAPGVNLWCGEIPNERLAEASDDVRAFADAAFGWWLVIYTHDSATVVGRVGAEEGRALLEYRLSPALRAASAIEAAAAGETRSGSTEGESAVGKAETPTPSGETPHG